MCRQFKNLRTFCIDVSLNKSQLESEIEDDWMKIEFPKIVDENFQDTTDVKIRFYRQYTTETVVTLTKRPNETTLISSC
jgi:hypothetical protein